jgi:L-threonylcarbamoyladenylate synthase
MKTLRLRLGRQPEPAAAHFKETPLTEALLNDPALQEAAKILRSGGLVAFPTETVYGLGANALDPVAVEKIFNAKQRPHWDPVIVHVAAVERARELTRAWPQAAEMLAEAFWPGPLTMLLPRGPQIPDICTAGRDKVGLRLPVHPVARALIAAAGVPVAAPSANRFGHTSPTTAAHVLADLEGRIDAILEADPDANWGHANWSQVGVESTVLDPTANPVIVYRPGGITAEQIQRLLGEVVVAEPKLSSDTPPEALESPGLGIRHYAPRARLLLVESQAELEQVLAREAALHRVGVLLPHPWPLPAPPDPADPLPAFPINVLRWGSWNEPESLARELYAQMRALDELGVAIIVCPMPPPQGIGLAIRDRLRKAAS